MICVIPRKSFVLGKDFRIWLTAISGTCSSPVHGTANISWKLSPKFLRTSGRGSVPNSPLSTHCLKPVLNWRKVFYSGLTMITTRRSTPLSTRFRPQLTSPCGTTRLAPNPASVSQLAFHRLPLDDVVLGGSMAYWTWTPAGACSKCCGTGFCGQIWFQ